MLTLVGVESEIPVQLLEDGKVHISRLAPPPHPICHGFGPSPGEPLRQVLRAQHGAGRLSPVPELPVLVLAGGGVSGDVLLSCLYNPACPKGRFARLVAGRALRPQGADRSLLERDTFGQIAFFGTRTPLWPRTLRRSPPFVSGLVRRPDEREEERGSHHETVELPSLRQHRAHISREFLGARGLPTSDPVASRQVTTDLVAGFFRRATPQVARIMWRKASRRPAGVRSDGKGGGPWRRTRRTLAPFLTLPDRPSRLCELRDKAC